MHFNNGKTDGNKLTKQLNDLLCCHHFLFSDNMLYLNRYSAHTYTPKKMDKTNYCYYQITLQRKCLRMEETILYPNACSSFLTSLKELGNISAHLLYLNLSPVPQQLYAWNCQLQQGFTVSANTNTHKNESKPSTIHK